MVEVDPPRVVSSGARTHNYYRRGDAVVAFVSLDNAMCERQPAYICVAAEVTACDAKRNMYTVRDPDAPSSEAAQNTWVVYWDQLLAIKRPYEVKYHVADQVYALFREDGSGDTAVSTEFFPGHVLSVGQLSLAVQFDSGALAHVYYDEVFAAGRVGFLRTHSAERRRLGAADSMVESSQGKFIPSFTGFWPNEAEPQLGKHGRKVRYRQKPPILVSQAPPPPELHAASSPGSDMDIDNSSPEPLSPAPQPVARSQQPPMHRRSPVSEEDGEIGAEEGEVSAQHSRSAYDRRSRWDRRSPVRRDDRSRSRFDSRESYRPEYRRSRRSRSRSSSPPRPKHAYRW
ncbi:hypothetical protein GGI20_003763 [Coemansia sp. BCRC 34301]|nr:hypothetical protein GGI20_003763 [Coemansia sp. BCRC 34301]